MTLIIASKRKDSVLIGADSRSLREIRGGTRIISNRGEKLIQLNKYCCVLIAGDAEKGTYLVESFKSKVNSRDDVSSINKKFYKFCSKEFKPLSDLMDITSPAYPDITFILAGLEKRKGSRNKVSRIYVLRSKSAFYPGAGHRLERTG